MKVSKLTWLILGIGILVIALGAMGMVYRGQSGERKDVEASLVQAQSVLPDLVAQNTALQAQSDELNARVAAARGLLSEAESGFALSVESIETGQELCKVADEKGLAVIDFTSDKPGSRKLNGITYSVTSFSITVEGGKIAEPGFGTAAAYKAYLDKTTADIMGYVTGIATDKYFGSFTVEGVSIDIPELISDDEVVSMGAGVPKPSATVAIAVYCYQGEDK
jgi:hypothetical protein